MKQISFRSGAGQGVDPPEEFVAVIELEELGLLGAPVFVDGPAIYGALTGRSMCSPQRWRVSWFDRRAGRVVHGWFGRAQIVLMKSVAGAADLPSEPATW